MNTAVLRHFVPTISCATAAALAVSSLVYFGNAPTANATCEQENRHSKEKNGSKLIFLGTGSSTGCPKPLCSMLFQANADKTSQVHEEFAEKCRVSNIAIQGDPKLNHNYRNNPSLLIQHVSENGQAKNIIVDVGKTFREGALRWMPFHNIASLDAIILTHHHMDAVAGLDDVRGFQRFTGLNRQDPPTRIPIGVFLSQECLSQVSSQFPWLFPKQEKPTTPADGPVVKRDVAALDVTVIEEYQPFDAAGLEIVPLPVWHGSDLICMGYGFSLPNQDGSLTNVVYISDISEMIPKTLDYIKEKLPPTDILIVDCLLPEFRHPVHYSLEQAVALSRDLNAKQTWLVGMSCDAFLPHDVMNEQLAKRHNGIIQFAHDGQVLYL